jgi:hypothetical protein
MSAVAAFVILASESAPEARLSLAPGWPAPPIGAGVGDLGFPDGALARAPAGARFPTGGAKFLDPFQRNQSGASASLDSPGETTFAKENQLCSWSG